MSTHARTTTKTVTLLRPGVGAEAFELPAGATVSDLLREARVPTGGPEILVDGQPLGETLVLRPGTVVTVSPAKGEAPPWRAAMGQFHNNPTFDEIMRDVQSERDAEKEQP